MSSIKRFIKEIFTATGTLSLLDELHFQWTKLVNARKNRSFLRSNPLFRMPPDRYLHETYRLDYQEYAEDGRLTAQEIMERVKPFIPSDKLRVLEWGCGVARITRHLKAIAGIAEVVGVDVNPGMIEWNRANIPDASFAIIDHSPPMNISNGRFDVVLAISVLTHIDAALQEAWLTEISGTLQPGGIFILTTHGEAFLEKLNNLEQERLLIEGIYTKPYLQQGHRMMSTYQNAEFFRKMLTRHFEVLEFLDGSKYPETAGGQDLWVVSRHKELN
jgi:SAM-dependent methyltransferase